MKMKIAITILWTMGVSGFLIQHNGLIKDVPDQITIPMIIVGLAGAIVTQYFQAQKQRKEHRDDLLKNNDKLLAMMEKSKESIDSLRLVIEKLVDRLD